MKKALTAGDLRDIVASALASINEELPAGQRLVVSAGAPLLAGGRLASLQVVNLALRIEEETSSRFGVELNLTDDEEIFGVSGPFATVDGLVEYLVQRAQRP